ncbi:nuclear transport factor 2 family protein [Sinorhizobium sp. CCBAU 05631]|uniref:YybH family protein n=1 Tax=Sinorhizobium sp. CCBAU 05631 TaxID=794846 RepID=UPI001FCAD665|nr:nuclear transport factor 2 family protein [Sinorhizobium sp. CCBAU 05631]
MLRYDCIAMLVAYFISMAPMEARAGPMEDVKAAYTAWDEAFGKRDAKAVATFYAEDALLLPPSHDLIEGPAGVEKFFSGIFGMGATDHRLEVIRVDGDGKLIYGAAKWSAKGKDARAKTSLGVGLPRMSLSAKPMAV